MDWYYYIAGVIILTQFLFLVLARRNYRYALAKYRRKRDWYKPKTALIVPCKGLDADFEKNIMSFFNQDYDDYRLFFVVAEKSDPAFPKLCELREKLAQNCDPADVQILIAGRVPSASCSQKVHNLLHAYRHIPDDVEVLAFADSDACIRNDWLSHIVYPLHNPEKYGAATGYRWFVPKTNNLATLALSAINAKVAQMLGNTHFNQAWGGSMAIRVDIFHELAIEQIWSSALSDDLSLSVAVRKAGKKVAFVPACLVASYESITWSRLFEFARRQFLITKVFAPRTWWLGLVSALCSALGLWVTTAVAVYAGLTNTGNAALFAAVPILLFAAQMTRAILRQKMISKLLADDWDKIKPACIADVFFFWAFSMLLLIFILSSAVGRTITWRNIRYKLISPTETIVLNN